MKPKSDNLFHFTNSIDVLKLILKNGVSPRYCLEDFSWFAGAHIKYVAYPMSCFCDIPISRISEHTEFYGMFGIGFTKDWGLKNGLNPVLYLTQSGSVRDTIEYFFNLDKPKNEKNDEQNENLFTLLSHIKPINGTMLIGGEPTSKDFYQENEWRFVPQINKLLFSDALEKEKDEANLKVEKYKLEFAPQDIKYIFVKSDSDIPNLFDFINTNLGHFPHNDLKILQSRIISLETLKLDL